MRRIYYLYPVIFILFLFLTGCSGGGDNDTSASVSGRVIQSYVQNATVCLDENENRICDVGEISTTTDANGYFHLPIPDDSSGLLLAQGGNVKGTGAPGLTLLAPPTAKNITPLTTLVALKPDLRAKIEQLGGTYDTDIASESGVNAKLLGLSLAIEATLYNLRNQLQLDASKQIILMASVANALDQTTLDSDDNIINAINQGVASALGINGTISSLTSSIQNILDDIGEGTVKESDFLAKITNELYSIYFPVFDPTHEIIPVPNDIIWAKTDHKIVLPVNSTDPAKNALYSAINKLELKGLSCNTPIAIPLSTNDTIEQGSLNNIYLVKISTLAGAVYQALETINPPDSPDINSIVTSLLQLTPEELGSITSALNLENIDVDDIEIIQDGNYLKIFPLRPLEPDTQYVVILKSGIKFTSGGNLISSTLFDLLKSSQEITSEDLKDLEPLRKSYSPLFILLKAFGIDKDNVLELFTFKTADKTLNLQDFGLIQASLENHMSLTDFLNYAGKNIAGLELSNITSEYFQINNAISIFKNNSFVNASTNTFISFDITTLANTPPTPIQVPYVIYNGESYTNSIVVFQHGLGGSKEDARLLRLFSLGVPIIAMDLPEHGGRSSDPEDSGKYYLTGNLAQDRINFYQSFFDIGLFLNLIKDGKFDIDGDGTNDTPTNIYFIGQSLGSITGSVATSLNGNAINKVVLNVGGANFAALIDQAQNSLILGLLNTLGLTKNNTEYFITLGVLQLLLDPSDPVYLAQDSIKDKLMIETSYHDTVVPNISNKILAKAIGFDSYEIITPTSSEPLSYNNWFMFKGEGERDWITHGILLGAHPEYYPEAEGHLCEDLSWAYDKVNEFIENYID